MPYLQLDVNGRHAPDAKRRLAQRMAEDYAALMAVDIRRISIAIRECGDDAVWRVVDGEPVPVSVLMLDIRRGRPADLRMAVAKRLIADCVELLGLREDRLNVEFTQHAGDEMYHPTLGGYSPEWSADEG
jgi:hypothetical protein